MYKVMTGVSWVESLLAIAGALIVVLLVYNIHENSQSPIIELKKVGWVCTNNKTQTHLQPMLIGSAQILQPYTVTECIEYKRIGN